MTKRQKGYLELLLVLIIFSLVIFIFDLPKISSFIIIGVIAIINLFVFEVFIWRRN